VNASGPRNAMAFGSKDVASMAVGANLPIIKSRGKIRLFSWE